MAERLDLKWGTVKGWSNLSESSIALLDGTIYNDWEGKIMSKDEAKKYVCDYRK